MKLVKVLIHSHNTFFFFFFFFIITDVIPIFMLLHPQFIKRESGLKTGVRKERLGLHVAFMIQSLFYLFVQLSSNTNRETHCDNTHNCTVWLATLPHNVRDARLQQGGIKLLFKKNEKKKNKI